MEITEVRIKLMEDASERLQAFCSITFDDCFVIRDLKIIEGSNGPFVAMPSRKLTAHCPGCGCKNHLRAAHCNQCGLRLKEDRAMRDEDGRAKLYADIAHPINSACRELIQNCVIEAFDRELQESKLPGYVSRYDDFDHEDAVAASAEHTVRQPAERRPASPRPTNTPVEQTHVQPAERPHGPHRAPVHQPAMHQPPAHQAPAHQPPAPRVVVNLAAVNHAPMNQVAALPPAPKTDGGFGAGIL